MNKFVIVILHLRVIPIFRFRFRLRFEPIWRYMSCDASVCSRLGLVFGLVIAVVGLVSSSAACSGAL